MQDSQITFQIIGQNTRAFPANSFLIIKNEEETICHMIFDDFSEDDAPCITISISPETLNNFIKNSKVIIDSSKNKNSSLVQWNKKRRLLNQFPPFRPSVIMVTRYNDLVHLSFGYLHPSAIVSYNEAKANSDEPKILQVPSLSEISMLESHFLNFFEAISKSTEI
jgi:hypothetical protein